KRYLELVDEVELALVAESARWGDQTSIYWLEPFQNLNPIVFTPDERWRPVVEFNVENFFPGRSAGFMRTLTSDDHNRRSPVLPTPDVAAKTEMIRMEARHGNKVYYTIDGSDPMLPNGKLSEAAIEYVDEVEITETTTITARSTNADNQWSAFAQVTYLTDVLPADASNLRITEVNYNPHAPFTQLGELNVDSDNFEFIELQNLSSSPIALQGVHFEPFAGKGISFEFGEQVLAPGQHVVVVRNIEAFSSRYNNTDTMALAVAVDGSIGEYDGGLANDGELLTLRDARGRLIQQFAYEDGGAWPGRADGNASSLELADIHGDYTLGTNYRNSSEFGGSPGFAGRGPDNRIVVNELLANSDEQLDRIELYNRSILPINIAGWYMSDSNNDYLKYRLPTSDALNVGRFAVFDESQLGFRLDSISGDDVYLIEADSGGRPTRFVDRIQFDAMAPGVSLGRLPDGSGQLYPMESVTLGAPNSGPMHGDIVVTEIQYDPGDPDGPGELTASSMEYIELYNRGSQEVDISGWRVRGGADFDFADGTKIAAGETVTLVSFDPNDASIRTLFNLLFTVSSSATLHGPLRGELANDADRVRVLRPEQPAPDAPDNIPYSLVDEVAYDSTTPWPEAIGGSNRSLHRNDVDAWGNDGRNWQLAAESPSKQNFERPVPGDLDGDRLVTAVDIDLVCGAVRQASSDLTYDLNADGTVDMEDYSYLLSDILYSMPGDANLDRLFDSSDLVLVFIAGQYNDDQVGNSTWASGDWNCDGEFNSGDIVAAFMTGAYRPNRAIPNPQKPDVVTRFEPANDNRLIVNRPKDAERPKIHRSKYVHEPTPYTGQSVDRLFDRIEPVWIPDEDARERFDPDEAERIV
ncbi:MAG: lamin tail domain-containing protein, partial [Planctomycetales bacterium]|nr:lamin tail domain-containing protein [Planctomycetales bacterium]